MTPPHRRGGTPTSTCPIAAVRLRRRWGKVGAEKRERERREEALERRKEGREGGWGEFTAAVTLKLGLAEDGSVDASDMILSSHINDVPIKTVRANIDNT